MKKLLAVSTAAAIGALAAPTIAHASSPHAATCHTTFSGHPENSSPPWAYDNFTRTTTITPASAPSTWTAHIADKGHFATVAGTTSDSGDKIIGHVTGTFSGSGDYVVTSTVQPTCVTAESYGGGNGPSTGQWPAHYFNPPATVTLIRWHWDYTTRCESMHEDSVTGTSGHMTGKVDCPTQTPTPTPTTPEPTPSDSNPAPSDSPSPSDSSSPTSDAPAPTPVKSNLPVTG